MIARRKNAALRLADVTAGQIAGHRDRGSSLIEILVTIAILIVGLLGLAGLQGRALTAQMESYQRSQALILLKDMVDRINANRANAAAYIATVGTGALTPASAPTTADLDKYEWHNALLGVAETSAGGTNVGAMIGARGCITQTIAPASGVPQYLVAVAWQGLNSTAVSTITCGVGAYGADEAKRRVIAVPVNIGCLTC